MVLCFLFMLHVLLYHVLNVKCSANYRKLSTHKKINRAYRSLRISVWAAHFVFPIQYVLKHAAILNPKSANIVLWFIRPCDGFDIVLTCSALNPYLGLLVSCTYPLSILQAIVVVGNCVHLNI